MLFSPQEAGREDPRGKLVAMVTAFVHALVCVTVYMPHPLLAAARGQSLSVTGGNMRREGSPSAYSLSAMDVSKPSVGPRLSKVC